MTEIAVETTEVPHIGGTPYLGFAVRAHAALLEEGLADPGEAVVWAEQSAIVARLATGDTIGIITFYQYPASNSLFACVAFVVHDFRRRGVFRLMCDELVKAAERRGATKIEAVTLAGNAPFARAAVASGFRQVAHTYRMDVGVDG